MNAAAEPGRAALESLAERLRGWGENDADPAYFQGDALSCVLLDCGAAGEAITKLLAENAAPAPTTAGHDPGRAAYEARFAQARPRDVEPWDSLPPEVRAIWARVERASQAREHAGFSGCGVHMVCGSSSDIDLVKRWCEQAATIPMLQERIREMQKVLADIRQKALTAEATIAVIRSLNEHAERDMAALKVSMRDERAAAAAALATAEQEAARWGSEYADAMNARWADAITMERVGSALAVFARIGINGPEDMPMPEWVAAVTGARAALKEAGLQRLLDPASGTPASDARRRA